MCFGMAERRRDSADPGRCQKEKREEREPASRKRDAVLPTQNMMKKICMPKDAVCIRSGILSDFPHGFSTRLGGVSPAGPTSSLNLAFGRGDDRETVLKNLSLFCGAVGVSPDSVTAPGQVHSARVVRVGAASRGTGYHRDNSLPSELPADGCDGLVTTDASLSLGVRVADCVPILLGDGKNGVIAALHAGWRGTVSGIALRGVEEMVVCGSDPTAIRAAIGPCIHACCYEVGREVYDAALRISPSLAAFFAPRGSAFLADLPGINRALLLRAGLLPQHVETLPLCTCCHPERFFSHRASQGRRGTMLALIALPKIE